MNPSELHQAIQQLNLMDIPKYQHDFNFISATIGKLRPDLSFEEQMNCARESAFFQIQASRDEADMDIISQVPRPAIDFHGKIIVTFHYSSYRLFISCLIAWGIRFKLVADNNFITNQGDQATESYDRIAEHFKADLPELEIINAETRTVILKCKEALKDGFALVFYADGNSGVGGMTRDNSNMVKIPFLDHSIYVRKGIVTLASIIQAPITTVLLDRDIWNNEFSFDIRENIPFPINRKNEDEIRVCNQALFSVLEQHLKTKPGPWEGWFYYHNFVDFDEFDTPTATERKCTDSLFNHLGFGVGVMAGNFYYILNKQTLRLVPISKEVFENLNTVIRENRITEKLPLYDSLFNQGILLASNPEPGH
ncbi:hypothetical protein KFE98_20665 [bacterium SCSIO 12741]|nr:hypothetical protein KFE98_20665 [bacterium SCSIO 12741]